MCAIFGKDKALIYNLISTSFKNSRRGTHRYAL